MTTFDFHQFRQESVKSLSTNFTSDWKKKAFICEFYDEDYEIKIQAIHKMSDPCLQSKLLCEQLDLTTKLFLSLFKTLEKSDLSTSKLEQIC